MDPLLQLLIAVPLALLFISASQHKRAGGARFKSQLDAYGLVPLWLLPSIAKALPWFELTVALGLLVPATRALAGLAGALLLTLYGAAMLINLLRGRRSIDCGCGGPAQPLSLWLVLRNALLASSAMLLMMPVQDRLLGPVDAFALLLMTLVFALTYLAAGQLLRNRAVLQGWNS